MGNRESQFVVTKMTFSYIKQGTVSHLVSSFQMGNICIAIPPPPPPPTPPQFIPRSQCNLSSSTVWHGNLKSIGYSANLCPVLIFSACAWNVHSKYISCHSTFWQQAIIKSATVLILFNIGYWLASNQVKILGQKRRVDILLIRTIIASANAIMCGMDTCSGGAIGGKG